MKEFIIQTIEEGQRLDKYIAKILANAPMSFTYKMLRKKNITYNGKKADGKERLLSGDVVRFFLSDETFEKFAAKSQSVSAKSVPFSSSGLKVLYEDDNILAFHKPVGLLSQKAEKKDISVNDYLLEYMKDKQGVSASFKPSICNRLDRNTSGIILCGKSMKGSKLLGNLLKDRTIQKYYRCIIIGRLEDADLTGYIKKDEKTNKIRFSETYFEGSERIETSWRTIEEFQIFDTVCSELEVHLITGKTHQIRGHLAGLSHPLIGDYKYGNRQFNDKLKKAYGIESQLLHAYKVIFPKKLEGFDNLEGLTIIDPLPKTFSEVKG